MAFDKELDKELFGKEESFDGTKIRVSVFSYNENAPKLQISRQNYDETSDDYRWAKLGRLTRTEAKKILPLIKEAIEVMDTKEE